MGIGSPGSTFGFGPGTSGSFGNGSGAGGSTSGCGGLGPGCGVLGAGTGTAAPSVPVALNAGDSSLLILPTTDSARSNSFAARAASSTLLSTIFSNLPKAPSTRLASARVPTKGMDASNANLAPSASPCAAYKAASNKDAASPYPGIVLAKAAPEWNVSGSVNKSLKYCFANSFGSAAIPCPASLVISITSAPPSPTCDA